MGYFSNGTEGTLFEEQWCNRCVHEDETGGCPVMLLHLEYNYEQNKNEQLASILDLFIPRDSKGFNLHCMMFARRV